MPLRKVILAKPRGFCAGVERAIEVVEQTLERFPGPVYVRKEIVHNPHVVSALRRKGAIFVEELTDVPSGATTIFSAHGVSPAVHGAAKARRLRVVDASIMPDCIRANTNVTTMMIGERIADFMRQGM